MRAGLILSSVVAFMAAATQTQAAGPAGAKPKASIKLAECEVYWHRSSGTIIVKQGEQYYYGTAKQLLPFARVQDPSASSQLTAEGLTLRCTNAISDNTPGLLLYCRGPYRFYGQAGTTFWQSLPQGKQTTVPVCPSRTGSGCPDLKLPCNLAPPPGQPARAPAKATQAPAPQQEPTQEPAKPAQPAPQPPVASQPAAPTPTEPPAGEAQYYTAPAVQIIEGEQVQPQEVMIYTQSTLIEEGPAVRAMSQHRENIRQVRFNFNSYRVGYSLPAEHEEGHWQFIGLVKAWRALSLGGVSIWPPFAYAPSRREAIRRARLLQPIPIAKEVPGAKNLRLYYYPSMVGYQDGEYVVDPMVLAFFIGPRSGQRMTVMLHQGRTYGAVGSPLGVAAQIYVEQVISYRAGFMGMGEARVPSIFYGRTIEPDVEPFPAGDNFDRLMSKVLAAYSQPPLSVETFQALFREMARYTGD